MASERRITSSRLGRLSLLGRLAGGIAGGVIGEGARQLVNGKRPALGDLLLTPANANRLAKRLSEMRGAAMKVGQLLSMDSGDLLPPELSNMLARLREDAHYMPIGQVGKVLNTAWGSDWPSRFSRFMFTPVAAASIGQVHEAVLEDGRRVAVKVQYPGIRQSIDADVDNVATLLNTFRVLPEQLELGPLLAEAKRQLHAEADYELEASALRAFGDSIADDARFSVPPVVEYLSNRDVLVMHFCDGDSIDRLHQAPAPVRNAIARSMAELALREVFEWGLVQTDPNFANYLYDTPSGRIHLLDFGATRRYGAALRNRLRQLLLRCLDGSSDQRIADAAMAVGYLTTGDEPGYRDTLVRLLKLATEPARVPGRYAFGDNDLARRMSALVVDMRLNRQLGRLPPTDILYLHRKLGGLYLLLSRLNASIAVSALVRDWVQGPAIHPLNPQPAAG